MSKFKTLTSGRLADLLEVDLKTVLNWARDGRLTPPTITLGGHARFNPETVRDDYKRAGAELPEPFAQYLETGEPAETPTQRARKLPTKVLRAELARREERGAA